MERRFDTDPAGGQHANEVSARKQQHITLGPPHATHYAIRPGGYLRRGFASRTTVPEEVPTRALAKDLGRPPAFIVSVVPLDQVAIDFGSSAETRKIASANSAL